MKRNYPLYIILALALVTRLIFAFGWHDVWWDSGVYIGMGKYLYSGGAAGLWEHIRPPLLPIILGFIWKIGLDPVLFGRLLEIAFMLGSVWLVYRLAERWWDEKTALLASLIMALSPIFYYLSFHQYNEIPSTFFLLLALWLAVREKYVWSGISAGLAFLSKFAPGMIIAVIILYLAHTRKWKACAYAAAGFAFTTLPYFLYSWMAYGSPLATFFAAQDAIKNVLGCNILRYKPWYQYGWWIVFSETKIHFMAIFGIIALWKKWKKTHLLYVFSLVLPALYFSQLHCRDYRYLTAFLPFVAMLTALGIVWLYDQFKIKKKWIFFAVVILLGAWMLKTSLIYYYGNELQQPDAVAEHYFSYLSANSVSGEIWTANPIVAAYTDAKLEKIYYPVYDTTLSTDFADYLKQNKQKIGAVLLDNCGGGVICPPDDSECTLRTQTLIEELNNHFTLAFDKQSGNCWYKIFTS